MAEQLLDETAEGWHGLREAWRLCSDYGGCYLLETRLLYQPLALLKCATVSRSGHSPASYHPTSLDQTLD